jgi:hypothetical protein
MASLVRMCYSKLDDMLIFLEKLLFCFLGCMVCNKLSYVLTLWSASCSTMFRCPDLSACFALSFVVFRCTTFDVLPGCPFSLVVNYTNVLPYVALNFVGCPSSLISTDLGSNVL